MNKPYFSHAEMTFQWSLTAEKLQEAIEAMYEYDVQWRATVEDVAVQTRLGSVQIGFGSWCDRLRLGANAAWRCWLDDTRHSHHDDVYTRHDELKARTSQYS